MKRKPKIIKDMKARGEWAESIFIARASEHGLPVSKPWGDSSSFDCVVGRPGRFVAVQVKSTAAKLAVGTGYGCSVGHNGRSYRAGSFDFLAAYVVPEDAWYLIPAKEIRGMKGISLWSTGGKYEKYLEAWHLLSKACETEKKTEAEIAEARGGETQVEPQPAAHVPGNALERMLEVEKIVRKRMGMGVSSAEGIEE
ncbi:MAG TPA: group I intron-associated PD-(D/E)XK endonuclease [Candidatus Aquilonibacter sp.]|nr:group I intron-associated PD-(D/E)XK endonuclease [Candidatus Aquilonibacter sp.]